jgi:hypothetical protein
MMTAVVKVTPETRQNPPELFRPGTPIVYSSRVNLTFSKLCKERLVASNTSKTARASVRAGEARGGALSVLGEYKYIIPLNSGKHAYVRNLTNGKTVHLSTTSQKFIEEVRTLANAGHGAKIRAELVALNEANPGHGWDATEKRLVEAGVFEAA